MGLVCGADRTDAVATPSSEDRLLELIDRLIMSQSTQNRSHWDALPSNFLDNTKNTGAAATSAPSGRQFSELFGTVWRHVDGNRRVEPRIVDEVLACIALVVHQPFKPVTPEDLAREL